MNVIQTQLYLNVNITNPVPTAYMLSQWCIFVKIISLCGKIKNDWCDTADFAHQHSKLFHPTLLKNRVLVSVSESSASAGCLQLQLGVHYARTIAWAAYTQIPFLFFSAMHFISCQIRKFNSKQQFSLSQITCIAEEQIAGVIDCTLKVGQFSKSVLSLAAQ